MPPSLTPECVLSEVRKEYDRKVMNNVLRAEYVEAMVALALRNVGWEHTDPWDSWDCEHKDCEHKDVVRLEVKHSARAQAWGTTNDNPRFDIRPRKTYWNREERVKVELETARRHADIYVFAWHRESRNSADQRKPESWEFHVVLASDLKSQQTIGLARIKGLGETCGVANLAAAVESARCKFRKAQLVK